MQNLVLKRFQYPYQAVIKCLTNLSGLWESDVKNGLKGHLVFMILIQIVIMINMIMISIIGIITILILYLMMAGSINITSYNCEGFKYRNFDYLNTVFNKCDILLLQET